MRLWQRVAGALKDRNSILIAQLSCRSSFRNPHLESVVIKATSHDQHHIDCKNVQRVFQWIRTSPLYLRPLIWALSMRMHKTRSWVVALKGLMLMHGIFCCDLPNVHKMGRLPFDFSDFGHNHSNADRVWAFNAFVRSYFAYLDQKFAFLASEFNKKSKQRRKTGDTLMEELERLQAMQVLIDMLLKIKPQNSSLHVSLVLEAMDCVVVELFDVYSKFCNGIAQALLRIYDIGEKGEAGLGLKVLQKAAIQCDELSVYFDFCREIGVLNASQCPKMERFPEGYMQDLERIINGVSEKESFKGDDEDMAIVVRNCNVNATASIVEHQESKNGLKTVITDKWEVFDDDDVVEGDTANAFGNNHGKPTFTTNPFEESYSIIPYCAASNLILPDLISF